MKGLLPVGRIGKLFGLDGGVTVNLYDTFTGNINHEEPLYVVIDTLAVPLFIESFEKRGRTGALIRFADIDNQVRAGELTGMEIYLKEFTDSDSDRNDAELYFEGLVGYGALISEAGSSNVLGGKITGYVDNEMNPLLTVQVGDDEVFIPANNDFIGSVDALTREIEFILPEGLLELYL